MTAQTKNPATVCQIEDLFSIDGMPPADIAEPLTAYLSAFAAPVRRDGKTHCLNCDKPIDGFMEMLGYGVAYRWGIVHGEGQCSGCGWPARGMHYIKDTTGKEIATLRNVFLAYHSDQVRTAADVVKAEQSA